MCVKIPYQLINSMQRRVTKARNEVAIGLNATFRACLLRGEGTQFLSGNPLIHLISYFILITFT